MSLPEGATVRAGRIGTAVALVLVYVAGLAFLPGGILLASGLRCFVSFGLCCASERRLSRLEERPFHMRSGSSN